MPVRRIPTQPPRFAEAAWIVGVVTFAGVSAIALCWVVVEAFRVETPPPAWRHTQW